jgi:hypothetical protein
MTTEKYDAFAKRMAEKFPRYYGDEHKYGGFAVSEGWWHIIEALTGQIDHYTKWRRQMRTYDLKLVRAKAKGRDALLKHITKNKDVPSFYDEERADEIMKNDQRPVTPKVGWIRVQQIKEKFGGLRFYYDGGDLYIDGLVSMAESWAGQTCETCGNKGQQRHGGWIRTLCDAHEDEYQDRIKQQQGTEDE